MADKQPHGRGTLEQKRTLEKSTRADALALVSIGEHPGLETRRERLVFLSSGSDKWGTQGSHRTDRGSEETTPRAGILGGKIQYLIKGTIISTVSSAWVKVDSSF